jgi:hypothetical protein
MAAPCVVGWRGSGRQPSAVDTTYKASQRRNIHRPDTGIEHGLPPPGDA